MLETYLSKKDCCIAILGADEHLVALVRRIVARWPDVRWVAAYDVPSDYQPLVRHLCGPIVFREDWEAMLVEPADTVWLISSRPITTSAYQRRCDQLRQLARCENLAIVVHPPCDSVLAYELESDSEKKARWIVYHPALLDPVLRPLLQSNSYASWQVTPSWQQLAIDRQMPPCSPEQVRIELSRDILWIHRTCGQIEKVGGWGGALHGQDFTLALQMQTDRGTLVRWSVRSGEPPQAHWTYTAPDVQVDAQYNPTAQRWSLSVNPPELSVGVTGNASEESLDLLATWDEFCFAEETVDTVLEAVKRQKNLEVVRIPYSEETHFKGVMAAGSCLVLLFLVFLLVVGAIVGGFRYSYPRSGMLDDMPPSSHTWPLLLRLWPVYLLLAFLALQILLLFARPRRPAPSNETSPRNQDTRSASLTNG